MGPSILTGEAASFLRVGGVDATALASGKIKVQEFIDVHRERRDEGRRFLGKYKPVDGSLIHLHPQEGESSP